MDYTNLGNSGLKVSRICLGTMTYGAPAWREWVLNEEQSRPFIRRALELGVNYFDSADMYSKGVSEEILGRALKDFTRREEVVIATKGFYPTAEDPNARGLSRKHLFDAIDSSLKRLGLDYVDLYQIHRWDETTPPEETLRALDDIVRSGRARYIGASSMSAWQFARALYLADANGWVRFIAMQNHYNLVYREEEREMLPLCRAEKIGVIPWSPLARGFLVGNRQRETEGETQRARTDTIAHDLYRTEEDFSIVARVQEVASKMEVTPAQVGLAWLLRQPGVAAPIVGASKMKHLEEAVASLSIELSDQDCAHLEESYIPHPVLGH